MALGHALSRNRSACQRTNESAKALRSQKLSFQKNETPVRFTFVTCADLGVKPATVEHRPTNLPTANPTISPPVAQNTPVAQGPSQNFDKINEYMQSLVSPPTVQCALLLTVSSQVRPLQEQIERFQSEFERLNLQVSELASTKAKLSDEVEQLKDRAHSAEDRLEKMNSEFEEFVREATAREQYVAESPL